MLYSPSRHRQLLVSAYRRKPATAQPCGCDFLGTEAKQATSRNQGSRSSPGASAQVWVVFLTATPPMLTPADCLES